MTHKYQTIDMPDFNNCGFADPQAQLGAALEKRNIQEFRVALDMGANPDQEHPETQMSVFMKTLQTHGCAEFVQECLNHGCNPSNINQSDKSALSYAADSRDPLIMERLLRHQSRTEKNMKQELDRRYAKLTPLNSLAKNLTAENAEDVAACIDLLLRYGASPNIPDQREITPILFVLKNKHISEGRKRQLVQKFLSTPGIDLDTYCDGDARRLLEKLFPDLQAPPVTSAEITLHTLLSDLSSHNEDNFLRNFDVYTSGPEQNVELLIETVKTGSHLAFDAVLKSTTDVNKTHNGSTAIEVACVWGNWVALEKLLDREDLKLRPDENLLISVVHKLDDESYNGFCDYKKCFFLLLRSGKVDVNEADVAGLTALHYAVKYRNKTAIVALLKRGAYIGAKTIFNNVAIEGMDSQILDEYFDSCITTNDRKPGDEGYEIKLNFSNFIPRQPNGKKLTHTAVRDEMAPITHMAESKDMRHLLNHPLVTSFLFLKWHRLSVLFYINFMVYSVFAVSFITHTIMKFNETDNQAARGIFGLLSLIGIGYLIVREVLQMVISPLGYFKSPINIFEILLIVLCAVTITEQTYDQKTARVVAVFTFLLLSVELCLLVGSLPVMSISTHMLMLKAVVNSFIKSFALYSIFVITFSLCFYILFGKEEAEGDFNKFSNPFTSIIKTIVMLTGEFDAGDIDFDSMYSYFLFLLFVIFMSIILFNLLNGLAVNDTQLIKQQAELNGSICRANLLTCYERLLTGQNHKTIFALIRRQRLINLFPDYIAGTHISILPNDRNKILIPVANSVELNEMRDNHSTQTIQPLQSDGEQKQKALDPPVQFLPCCCSCVTNRCAEMDSRTVKMALAVIDRKNAAIQQRRQLEQQEARLKNMEFKIEKIFELVQSLT